jgi:hypothetical protein
MGEHITDNRGIKGNIIAVDLRARAMTGDDLLDREIPGTAYIAFAVRKDAGVGIKELPQFFID